jgi:hypothetical protein
MQKLMMICIKCGKEFPLANPIRRTCGDHSGTVRDDMWKFLMTIKKNFQNPFYQNHSHGIFTDDEDERYYTQIWWGY